MSQNDSSHALSWFINSGHIHKYRDQKAVHWTDNMAHNPQQQDSEPLFRHTIRFYPEAGSETGIKRKNCPKFLFFYVQVTQLE